MIDRYSRDQMKKVWSENNKYDKWLEVEISVCQAWHKQGVIPKSDIVKSLIFIVSSNNQHFFCTFNYNKKLNIEKLNLKTITKLLETKKYTHTFSNYKLPYEINEIIDIKNRL